MSVDLFGLINYWNVLQDFLCANCGSVDINSFDLDLDIGVTFYKLAC